MTDTTDKQIAKRMLHDWLGEAEGYSSRQERLLYDVRASPIEVMKWLEEAFLLGVRAAATTDPCPAGRDVEEWVQARRRWVEEARNFPENTCPASRHAQMIADGLADEGTYPALTDDPAHAAGSIYGTIAALWDARTRIAELESKAELDVAGASPSG